MEPNQQGGVTNYFNDPRLQQAQQQYQQTAQAATESQAQGQTLPQMLQDALQKKFGENNPLVQQREGATQNYLNSIPASQSAVLPENQGGVVLNPLQQANLIQQRQSASLAPLTTANYLLGLHQQGLGNVIQNATAAHQAQTTRLMGGAQTARTSYQDILNELSGRADIALKEKALNLQMSGGIKGLAAQQLVTDAQNGLTLQDALNKYAGRLDPQEVFSIYNTSSKYGPAKEDPNQLLGMGIKPALTTDQLARREALKPAEAAINLLDDKAISMAGPQNNIQKFMIDHLGGFGVDQKIVGLNSDFELMKQNVVRALQGARMSDQDIALAAGYIPSITDTPETVRTKLAKLRTFINVISGESIQSGTQSTKPSLDQIFQ